MKRRAVLGSVAALGSALAGCGRLGQGETADPPPASGIDWTTPQRSAARTLSAPVTAPTTDLQPAWSTDLGEPPGWVEPLIVGDTLFAASPESITALDVTNGETVFTTEFGAFTTPLYSNGRLIARPDKGEERFVGEQDTVLALDATDGSQLWTKGPGDHDYIDFKTVADDTLLYTRFGYDTLRKGSKELVALDLAGPEELWTKSRPSNVDHAGADFRNVVVYDGTVFVSEYWKKGDYSLRESENAIHAFDLETGEELWSRPITLLPLAADDGTLLVGKMVVFEDGDLYDFAYVELTLRDPATGDIQARSDGHRIRPSSVAFADGVAYARTNDDQVQAIDVRADEISWTYEKVGPAVDSLTTTDNAVFIPMKTRLDVVDNRSGERVASHDDLIAWGGIRQREDVLFTWEKEGTVSALR